MTTQKCAACHRQTSFGVYCPNHTQALENLRGHYKEWVNAYGNISWKDFLDKLSAMKETGSWVKEVIEVELEK